MLSLLSGVGGMVAGPRTDPSLHLKKLLAFSQSGYTMLHSHQQRAASLVVPHLFLLLFCSLGKLSEGTI